jgi:hypothetical protein
MLAFILLQKCLHCVLGCFMIFVVHVVCLIHGWSEMDWHMGDSLLKDLHSGKIFPSDSLTSCGCLFGILP